MYESFVRLGLSESAAALAARGRDPAPAGDPFDEAVERFRGLGLSEAAAKTAAIGRGGSESAARREWGGTPHTPAGGAAGSMLALRFEALEEARAVKRRAAQPGLSDAARVELLGVAVRLLEAALVDSPRPPTGKRSVKPEAGKPAAARRARRYVIETGEIVRRLS